VAGGQHLAAAFGMASRADRQQAGPILDMWVDSGNAHHGGGTRLDDGDRELLRRQRGKARRRCRLDLLDALPVRRRRYAFEQQAVLAHRESL
jgi:hypothetical protein